jgi:hypothetical protein
MLSTVGNSFRGGWGFRDDRAGALSGAPVLLIASFRHANAM